MLDTFAVRAKGVEWGGPGVAAQGIPVGVVDNHPLYRAAVVGLLEDTPGMVVDAVGDSVARFSARRRWSNSIVVMDPDLPVLRGADAVRALVGMGHRVLVLSDRNDRAWARGAVAAGAHGCLSKQADGSVILAVIRRIAAGHRTHLPPVLPPVVAPAPPPSPAAPGIELSAREREVLDRLAAGDRDQDIAQTLRISVGTVRSYLERVRDKTGLRRRSELTRYAIEHGVATDDRDSTGHRRTA
jgi:DNA-binding NarL/FixJ family response regulator